MIRYEDLVCDPVGTLGSVLPDGMGLSVADVLSGRHARAAVSHTVSGNPLRFERGPLSIRTDVEWITKLHLRDRGIVTGLTWPLLLRYGYPLVPRVAP
jgi:hypothetical protein